jgi:DNA-binding IclR family transcriptional regulator
MSKRTTLPPLGSPTEPATESVTDPATEPATPAKAQRGIQSMEVGGSLLRVMAQMGRPLALKDLAAAAQMPPAKAHPYLVSLGKVGLIEQDAATGRYGLGPLAMELGLISLQQYDPVRLASPRLPELAQQLGLTVAIAVWGNLGPTIVRVEEAPTAVHVNMRHGTVMSMRGTASGLLFAAYRPLPDVLAVLSREAGHAVMNVDDAFAAELQWVRAHGMARVREASVAGISALAAPVFDDRGTLMLSLAAIGPSAKLAVEPGSPAAQTLGAAAQALTRQLGGVSPARAAG